MPGTRRVPKKKDCREKEEQGEGLRFRMRKIFFCVDVRKKVEKTNNMEINNCVPGRFLYFCSQEKMARAPPPQNTNKNLGRIPYHYMPEKREAITKALPSLDAQTTTRLIQLLGTIEREPEPTVRERMLPPPKSEQQEEVYETEIVQRV